MRAVDVRRDEYCRRKLWFVNKLVGSDMSVTGKGLVDGYLPPEEVTRVAREGLARLPVDGARVLVLIPDGTRTMPMPLMFDALSSVLRAGGAPLPRGARHATR